MITLDERIKGLLELDNWQPLIKTDAPAQRVTLDFDTPAVDQFNRAKYVIRVADGIKRHMDMACIFPNHASTRKNVLWVRSYAPLVAALSDTSFCSLAKDINGTIKDSQFDTNGCTTKLAICYGRTVYLCTKFTGTIYLLWATHVNHMSADVPTAPTSDLRRDCPIIINMNGHHRISRIFVLPSFSDLDQTTPVIGIPISRETPDITWDTSIPIFVCEVQQTAASEERRRIAAAAPNLISERKALQIASRLVGWTTSKQEDDSSLVSLDEEVVDAPLTLELVE